MTPWDARARELSDRNPRRFTRERSRFFFLSSLDYAAVNRVGGVGGDARLHHRQM